MGGKVYAEAVWTEAGEEMSVEGFPCRAEIEGLISSSIERTAPEETFALLDAVGAQVVELQGAR
jgi:hypothetical protein